MSEEPRNYKPGKCWSCGQEIAFDFFLFQQKPLCAICDTPEMREFYYNWLRDHITTRVPITRLPSLKD